MKKKKKKIKKKIASSSATTLSSGIVADGLGTARSCSKIAFFYFFRKEGEIPHLCTLYDAHLEKNRGKQHKKLHNRFLTLFSCAGELSHRHHLTRAANLRGAGGAPPSSKPVPNRIEPLRTKAAKFGGGGGGKTNHTEPPGPGASTPPGKGSSFRGDTTGGKWGAEGPHLPSFGRDARSHYATPLPPSLSSPSFCSPSRAFRTHIYIGVTPTAERSVRGGPR